MITLNLQNGEFRIEDSPAGLHPNIVIKTEEVCLSSRLSRNSVKDILQLLKEGSSGTIALRYDCEFIFNGKNNISLITKTWSGITSASMCFDEEDILKLIIELEGYYEIRSNNPIVKQLYEENVIIECTLEEELNKLFVLLDKEGIRFRSGTSLAVDNVPQHITTKYPIYLQRKKNSWCTDSIRLCDFLSWSYKLHDSSSKVISAREAINLMQG